MKNINTAGFEELEPRLPERLFDLVTTGKLDIIEWHLSVVGLRRWLPSTSGANFI